MPVNLQNGTSFVNDADPINLIIILHMFDTILIDSYIPATVGAGTIVPSRRPSMRSFCNSGEGHSVSGSMFSLPTTLSPSIDSCAEPQISLGSISKIG